jgi:TonB family protein
MRKSIFIFILVTFFLQGVKAEKSDSLVVYLKNSGQKVKTIDSADYFRVIFPPDTSVDRDLYRVYDYYLDGKPKSVGTSLTGTINLVLDGTCLNFFPNGKRKSSLQFKNGKYVGVITNYYPNGKLYNVLKISEDFSGYYDRYYHGPSSNSNDRYKVKVMELRDSTGNLLAENGKGHIIIYDDEYKKVLEEGDLDDNKKEGLWRGLIADTGKYICVYHKDEIKSGTSYMKSGKRYSFLHFEVNPVFSDGMPAFYAFIKKNLQYLESAKKRKVMGTVTVEFDVEINGTLSDVKVGRGLMKSLDDEALRVIKLSPLWVPGSEYGMPMRMHYKVPVVFSIYN